MKPIAKFVMAAFAATALTPAAVFAQSVVNRSQGYLVENDSSARTIVRNGYGECWQHLDADSPMIQPSCNPAPVAVAPPPPAPAVIAAAPPPPAPAPVVVKQQKKISQFSGLEYIICLI